ncbi:FAD-dependent oxidoreductase [bacterium]|nr:FAD-dependent oxidoreductase [bacterium]
MRIAIVGAGISGLVAAELLRRHHEITVLEAGDRIGGHTNTVRVEHDGAVRAIDTGFIVYNEANYPLFTRLLGRLGVASRPTTMTFSVRSDPEGLEYNGDSLGKLFAQRRNLLRPSFHRMVRDILRFYRRAAEQAAVAAPDATVEDFVARHGYGREFVRDHLVPMGSALWSCPPGRFLSFPIRLVVEFFANHRMLQVTGRPEWRTIEGGSYRYVDALVRPFRNRIRLSTPVRAVRRLTDGVDVHTTNDGPERFDEIVLACHADQALRMLEDASPRESAVLGSFPYQRNDVALHTDESVLPRRRRAWAAWNYHVRRHGEEAATVTYDMNILQGLVARSTYCVTLNESKSIDPDLVLHRVSYEHPVFTPERSSAAERHHDLMRHNRTSFCGAYWGYGFHEDGVRSAVAVAAAYGEKLE